MNPSAQLGRGEGFLDNLNSSWDIIPTRHYCNRHTRVFLQNPVPKLQSLHTCPQSQVRQHQMNCSCEIPERS